MARGLALSEIFIRPIFDGKGVFAGIKKFSKQLNGLKKPVKALNSSFNGLFKVAGIAGLTAMTLNAAKLGREMGLISRKTGIAVENISSMQNAFAASGGDAKEVSRTLDRITTGLARVSMGDASFTSSLASMGISAWENGRLKNAEKVRMDMADWIKGQLDAGRSLAQVATFMNETFGMSQAEVEHLSVGSKKLLEIQQKYNKEIGVLSKEESKALDEINNSVSQLRATVGVTFDKLVAETAPILESVLDGFQNVIKFIQDNKDLFGPLLTGLAGFSLALKALPALFSAIAAHPLVALALTSMAAGYGIGVMGGSEEAKKERERLKLDEPEVYARMMVRLGYWEKRDGFFEDKETGAMIFSGWTPDDKINDNILVVDEITGEPVDFSKVPDLNLNGDNKTVNVEINTTNNIDGAKEGDIVYLTDEQGHIYANYVVKAADGGD